MRRFFLGLTLGGDPHTVGIYKAARIGKMIGVDSHIIRPDASVQQKIASIREFDPMFVGLSYRLSVEQAIQELRFFLQLMEDAGLLNDRERRIAFAGLPSTLERIRRLGWNKTHNLHLMGGDKTAERSTLRTLEFFRMSSSVERERVVSTIRHEMEPERISIIDQIAREVVSNNKYLNEPPLPKPTKQAQTSLITRMEQSDIPLIRTHFGVPDETIQPTIDGIQELADAHVVDEISLGSSDLSQRYYGNPLAFKARKNDGGVPYKTKEDLRLLYEATRRGNYPAIKPYCHVTGFKSFAADCLDVGMLVGAHQAVPLFWFSELDGRGPLSVPQAIVEHIELVEFLAQKGIPVEMNDPNHWSSRFAHDTVFVADYALIAAVMYKAGVQDVILQCQFNKPAETGDYADLAKMRAALGLVEAVRPQGHRARLLIETRSGIEHFSSDLETAKYQLARSTLLQMLLNPNMIHLVSYCEADHAATFMDIIESSKVVRRGIRLFRQHERDIREAANHPFVEDRYCYLRHETEHLLRQIAALHPQGRDVPWYQLYKFLSDPMVLELAIARRCMAAPGITHPRYSNPDMLTKPTKFGGIDCFLHWEDPLPMTEEKRISQLLQAESD